MNKFETQESLVSGFLSALNNAGLQPAGGSDQTKTKYYRGFVTKAGSDAALYVRYNVDDNDTVYSSDDSDFMRGIEIGGEVYTKNGYGDTDYQDLCYNIEESCKESGYILEWGGESTDASFDPDSPVALKRFTVTKNKI